MIPTQKDEQETALEIIYLLSDVDDKLSRVKKVLKKQKGHINPQTYESINQTIEHYQKTLAQHLTQIQSNMFEDTLQDQAREFLRTSIGQIAALITSTDWQSPTFAHALFSQAGRETGKIYATRNDYKRDQHWDAFIYEQAFLKEYIDVFFKLPAHVFATSSGMAAFTTILLFLIGEKKLSGPILAGDSIYFENKGMLTQLFGDNVVYSNEQNLESFIHDVQTHKPAAIFIDSLTNAPDIITPDVTQLIQWLVSHVERETYLIIDNTGLSVALQPYKHIVARRTKLRIITFESLNKYHQFGLDRTTGGIITAYGTETGKLFEYRDHAGTNISDVAAAMLPTPNRKFLTAKLKRHERNAKMLSSALQTWITSHPKHAVTGVSYPGQGSYLALQFAHNKQTIPTYNKFVSKALAHAKRLNVNLTSGTSFGLPTTRIYLTAVRSHPNTPFVRIALGTEHKLSIRTLIEVFVQTMQQF